MLVRSSLSIVLLGALACSSEAAPGSTFVVEVFGSRKTIVDRPLYGSGLRQVDTDFRSSRFVAVFEADASLDRLIEEQASVGLSTEEENGSELSIRPHVCASVVDYWDWRADGYSSVEMFQAILTDDGEWKTNTDFTRNLQYSCELTKGGNGSGWATAWAQANECDAPEAAGTSVQADSGGALSGLVADTCETFETNRGDGVFAFQIVLRNDEMSVLIHGGFCFLPDGPTFPYLWSAGDVSPVEGCIEDTIAEFTRFAVGSVPVDVSPTQGGWQVTSATLGDPGVHATDLDLTFPIPGDSGRTLRVKGTLRGPVYRFPVR